MTKEDYAQMLEAMRKRTVAEPQIAEAWASALPRRNSRGLHGPSMVKRR